jgi:hypothetical protein
VFKSSNSASKGENFKKIGYVITLGECFENKWFNMKCAPLLGLENLQKKN